MQLLNGYKTSDRLLLLRGNRKVSRDNVWGLRVLMLGLFWYLASQTIETYYVFRNGDLIEQTIFNELAFVGVIIGVFGVYVLCLHLFSEQID